MLLSIPNRETNFNRAKNSVIPQNIVFDIATHGIASAEDELLNIEKWMVRKLSVETQDQKIVRVPEAAYILPLPQPIEEVPVRSHPGICRVKGIDSDIEGRT